MLSANGSVNKSFIKSGGPGRGRTMDDSGAGTSLKGYLIPRSASAAKMQVSSVTPVPAHHHQLDMLRSGAGAGTGAGPSTTSKNSGVVYSDAAAVVNAYATQVPASSSMTFLTPQIANT